MPARLHLVGDRAACAAWSQLLERASANLDLPIGGTTDLALLPTGDREARRDLDRHLEGADRSGSPTVLVGLGRGGTLAFQLACTSRRVAAAVCVAGPLIHSELSAQRPVQPIELVLNLDVPVLLGFAERDSRTPPDHVMRVRRELEHASKRFELEVLNGAGAGFFDPGSSGYDAPACAALAQRATRFLSEVLDPS